jgi:hypothetical protein
METGNAAPSNRYRWEFLIQGAMLMCMVAAVWRLWVLAREVRDKGRGRPTEVTRPTAVAVYHAASGNVTLGLTAAAGTGKPKASSSTNNGVANPRGIPLVMAYSEGALALETFALSCATKHVIITGNIYEAVSWARFSPAVAGRWSTPSSGDGRGHAVWLLPYVHEAVPPLGRVGGDTVLLALETNDVPADARGCVTAYVLGM